MHTEFEFWKSIDECSSIRAFMLDHHLYETSYKMSRFKRFIDKGDCYQQGFSLKLYDDCNNVIGLLLAENIDSMIMPGGLRKKTRDYGFAGEITEYLLHNFIILASIGIYIKPEYRGNHYSSFLLNELESKVIPFFVRNYKFEANDIPVFSCREPLYRIAEKALKYSRPVQYSNDCSGLRNNLHYWSVKEKPMHKYDPYPMVHAIKHWSELVQTNALVPTATSLSCEV